MSDPGWRPLRRQILIGGAAMLAGANTAFARTYIGDQPFTPFGDSAQAPFTPGDWQFFSPEEAKTIEAIVARLIPADDYSVSGKDAGCAVYIDRQLASAYGRSADLYMKGPFLPGTPMQGNQSANPPAVLYRTGLAAFHQYLGKAHGGKSFDALSATEQDDLLTAWEAGKIDLGDTDAKTLFAQILTNAMEGFFADPIYGGNRDMVSWRMIGFPGARYDYRDTIEQHGKKFDFEPVGLQGGADWKRT